MHYSCYIYFSSHNLCWIRQQLGFSQYVLHYVHIVKMACNLQTKPLKGPHGNRKDWSGGKDLKMFLLLCIFSQAESSMFFKCISSKFPTANLFLVHLLGLNIEIEEKSEWERETSHTGILSDHPFCADFSNYGWVTCNVANGEVVGTRFHCRHQLMSFLSSISVISVREQMKATISLRKCFPDTSNCDEIKYHFSKQLLSFDHTVFRLCFFVIFRTTKYLHSVTLNFLL